MLVVLSFDGLVSSAVGVYGSPWNETPVLDAIAASGVVMDRMILKSDRSSDNLADWLAATNADGHWTDRHAEAGPLVMVTDDPDAEDAAAEFDEVIFVDMGDADDATIPEDLEETRLGKLMLAAIERDSAGGKGDEGQPSVLWIHSRFLRDAWDAPRGLFPSYTEPESRWSSEFEDEEMEYEEQEEDESEEDKSEEDEREDGQEAPVPPVDPNDFATLQAIQEAEVDPLDEAEEDFFESAIPSIFDQVKPPSFQCQPGDDPDLLMSWMRTYGCQVRLIDLLTEVLLASLSDDDPQVMVLSTSGLCLGQNGFFEASSTKDTANPLVSAEIQVPMIVSDVGMLRWTHLCSHEMVAAALSGTVAELLLPDRYAADQKAEIEIDSSRVKQAVMTEDWFYVSDAEGQERLFVKPDDAEDVNDVARLRPDIVERLRGVSKL